MQGWTRRFRRGLGRVRVQSRKVTSLKYRSNDKRCKINSEIGDIELVNIDTNSGFRLGQTNTLHIMEFNIGS